MINKKYLNISEVSQMLQIEEHKIRYWDSLDPRTNKFRVEGISTKSKGGTRYFNKDHITKIQRLRDLLYDNGNQNYSLKIVDKLLSSSKKKSFNNRNDTNISKSSDIKNIEKIRKILSNMRLLTK